MSSVHRVLKQQMLRQFPGTSQKKSWTPTCLYTLNPKIVDSLVVVYVQGFRSPAILTVTLTKYRSWTESITFFPDSMSFCENPY